MGSPAAGRVAASVLAVCVVVAGCSAPAPTPAATPPWAAVRPQAAVTTPSSSTPSTSSTPPQTTTPVPSTWSLVALGDSVPRGTNCGCVPYPSLSAQQLSAPAGRGVVVTNDAVSGYTTANVLGQLQSDSGVIADVRAANVIELEIGANDVGFSPSCGTDASCYTRRIPTVARNLSAIESRIQQLVSGHQVLVVLLDYWSVWLGGKYAAARGSAYVSADAEVTDEVNAVIASTAATAHSAYVDLRTALEGPNHDQDETPYLAFDGDHPNAAGHLKIATAAVDVIRSALHL